MNTATTVASNIRRLRDERGLSLRKLSGALEKRGWNLSADAINKIENGRELQPGAPMPKQIRRVDVGDLVALAAVLGVSTDELLLPPEQTGRGAGHRATGLAAELADALRDVVAPTTGTDTAARARTARRLIAQLALELDEIDDSTHTPGQGDQP